MMYLHFKNDIEADRARVREQRPDMEDYPGRPSTFAGSIPEEVVALKTPQEMAWKLSNEMFVNYGDASPVTEGLARHAAPFIRFHTGNNMWYFRYIRNAINHGRIQRQVAEQMGLPPGGPPGGGRPPRGGGPPGEGGGPQGLDWSSAARAAGMIGSKGFQFYLKSRLALMGILWGTSSLAWVWNNMIMGDIEDELPDYQRRQFHVNLGKGEDGSNRIFLRGATSPEFLSSLGMDGEFLPRGLRMFTGDVLPGEFVAETMDTFANHWGQMKGPYISAAYAAMGLDTYPNILEPRRVKDRFKEVFDAVGLGEEYAAIAGKPSRWSDRYVGGEDFLWQTYEPGLNSYNRIRDEVREFREKVLGKYGYQGGMATGKRSDALYYMKQAIKYKDPAAAEYHMLQYIQTFTQVRNGEMYIDVKAVERALNQSTRMRAPLGALSDADTVRMSKDDPGFLLSLVPEQDRSEYAGSLPFNFYDLGHEEKVRLMIEALPEPHRSNILQAQEYYRQYQFEPLKRAYSGEEGTGGAIQKAKAGDFGE